MVNRRSFFATSLAPLAAPQAKSETVEFFAYPTLYCPQCFNALFFYPLQHLTPDGLSVTRRQIICEHEVTPYCPNSGKRFDGEPLKFALTPIEEKPHEAA